VILVDSSVWIEADNRRGSREALELDALLERDEVATTDIVVAEVIQGAPTEAKFKQLLDMMSNLHYFHAGSENWHTAAELSFALRRQGLTTPLSDLVIATVALANDLELYSLDRHYSRVSGLKLHEASQRE
jgi:predicted nucleic acid-binding protein